MYRICLEAGVDPPDFWTYTIGELMAILGRQERADRTAWMHTGSLMALQANMHRRKGAKALTWEEFSPHDYTAPAYTPTLPTEKHREQAQNWAKYM